MASVDGAVLDPGLMDEGALDLRPDLVALVVQHPGQRRAGLSFA